MNLDFFKNKIEIQLLNWARTMNWMNNYGFQFFNIQGKDAISKKLYQTWESKRNSCLMRPFRLLLITNTTFSVKTQLNVQFSDSATCCEVIFDKENVFLICFFHWQNIIWVLGDLNFDLLSNQNLKTSKRAVKIKLF